MVFIASPWLPTVAPRLAGLGALTAQPAGRGVQQLPADGHVHRASSPTGSQALGFRSGAARLGELHGCHVGSSARRVGVGDALFRFRVPGIT